MHTPDWVLTVEIREHAYLYGPSIDGPYGLPTGSSGKGLLLLSGGIDSPVAGWMMAKRGMAIEAVYFHSAPFTSEKAREKVETLAKTLSAWAPGIVLHVVPFTPVLARIKEKVEGRRGDPSPAGLHDALLDAARGGARCHVPGDGRKPGAGRKPDGGEHALHRFAHRSSRLPTSCGYEQGGDHRDRDKDRHLRNLEFALRGLLRAFLPRPSSHPSRGAENEAQLCPVGRRGSSGASSRKDRAGAL